MMVVPDESRIRPLLSSVYRPPSSTLYHVLLSALHRLSRYFGLLGTAVELESGNRFDQAVSGHLAQCLRSFEHAQFLEAGELQEARLRDAIAADVQKDKVGKLSQVRYSGVGHRRLVDVEHC